MYIYMNYIYLKSVVCFCNIRNLNVYISIVIETCFFYIILCINKYELYEGKIT